jgi:hypothetical protein
MELTIHIGSHKTGSTALQAAFAKASGALKRKGVLYPKTHWRQTAHHRLAFALKGKSVPRGDQPDLELELDKLMSALMAFGGGKALISSEEFFTCPEDALHELKRALGIPVRIVCFLRRPDTFLVSCYNQKIKQPGNGFSPPLAKFLRNPRAIAPEMDYLSALFTWADVFGDAAIALETYETGSPLLRMCQILGLETPLDDSDQSVNASVPGAVAETIRHAKVFGLNEGKQRKILARARQVYAGYPPFFVANEDRRAVIAEMEEDMDRLFQRFGQTNPYRVDTFAPVPQEDTANISLQDMMRLVASFV